MAEPTPAAAGAGAGTPFRPDIDGMRAIAILAVVGFHAGVPGFAGGFVGVDVFFVISGYLITRNLLAEHERTGRVALGAFWGRRLRRLAPALALMLVATLAAAAVILSPLEWTAAGRDALASSLYVSNIAYARQATDYFADGTVNLYLHTWSLSVEEQFYVVWPLLAVAALAVGRAVGLRRRTAVGIAFAIAAIGSFALALVMTDRGTPWAFFSLPARAWQFAVAGALAAVALRAPRRVPLAGAGLVAIAVAVVSFDSLTPYPGLAALVPTLGAAAMIAGGGHDRALLGRALGARPVQYIGRVSYSWYLWHWPVMLLAVAALDRDRLDVRLGAMAVSFAIGAASYRWLEQPVRMHPTLRASPARSIAVGVGCAAAGAVAALALGALADRTLDRSPYDQLAAADADLDYGEACRSDPDLAGTCVLGPAEGPLVYVVGDSHAEALIPALAEVADDDGVRIAVRTRGGCPSPDVDIAQQGTRDGSAGCERFRAETRAQLDARRPALVVLANATYQGRILDEGAVPGLARQHERWGEALASQLAAIRAGGSKAAIVLTGPHLEDDPLICVARHGLDRCTPTRDQAMADVDPFHRVEREAAAAGGPVALLDASTLLCDDRRCALRVDGTYTLLDADHFTASFARAADDELRDLIARGLAGEAPS